MNTFQFPFNFQYTVRAQTNENENNTLLSPGTSVKIVKKKTNKQTNEQIIKNKNKTFRVDSEAAICPVRGPKSSSVITIQTVK